MKERTFNSATIAVTITEAGVLRRIEDKTKTEQPRRHILVFRHMTAKTER